MWVFCEKLRQIWVFLLELRVEVKILLDRVYPRKRSKEREVLSAGENWELRKKAKEYWVAGCGWLGPGDFPFLGTRSLVQHTLLEFLCWI